MRKLYNIFLLVGVIAITMVACEKESKNPNSVEDSKPVNLEFKKIENQINTFQDQMEMVRKNPNLKYGDELWAIDTAIWYLEATANYIYGDASYERLDFIIDSAFVSFEITSDEVVFEDIIAAYDDIYQVLYDHNSAIQTDDKQLILVDISLVENDMKSTEATVKVTTGFGTQSNIDLSNTDSWYWGWALGKCDGTGAGQDAADITAILANEEIFIPSGNSYYVNVNTTDEIWAWDYADANGDAFLFDDFQEEELNHACLSAAQIEQYKNNLVNVANLLKPHRKSAVNYLVEDHWAGALCGPDYDQHDCWYMHWMTRITYGMWITKIDDDNPPSPID